MAFRNHADEIETVKANEAKDRALIQGAIPVGKSYADAVKLATGRKLFLWSNRASMSRHENARIAELGDYCRGLCGGGREAGEALAMAATWA